MRIKEAAIRLLARREHSRRELSMKLSQRGFDPDAIRPVLLSLESEGLLSNARFIGTIVRVRSGKGVGPLKIIQELKSHGISKEDVEHDEDWQQIDWIQVAQKARIKRFGQILPQERDEILRQRRFLTQRGFFAEQIKEVLNSR